MSVEVTRLSSGLRVVTDAMPHLQTASLGVWVGAGSRDELADEHGISHGYANAIVHEWEMRRRLRLNSA